MQRDSFTNLKIPQDSVPEGKPIRIVESSPYGMSSTGRRLTIDSLVDPITASGPTHLLQLRGHCFNLKSGEYSYEFCPFFNASQREVTSRWNSYHGLLGVWSGWLFQNNSDYIQGMRYTFGDKCGSHSYKNASVVFECSADNNTLHEVSEPDKCEFRFTFLTQLVCRREWRAVFRHLQGESRDSWLRVQLEHSLGYLTEKGVQHLKQDILKKMNWIGELNLTRLRSSEKEREDDMSSHERHTFIPPYMRAQQDCSECQKELEAVRGQLSETSTLLKLVNRTFQEGINANQSHASVIHALRELLDSCDTSDEKAAAAPVSISREDSYNGTVAIDTETETETERGAAVQGLVNTEDEELRDVYEGARGEFGQLDGLIEQN